ncbi:MAG: redox-regulated ATPase YchF [Chloroflexi bacterium]|nr:redox-regulated ATPase YchF [Chloroflexota bacterium]
MQIAIIGLPNSTKTTVFNALTRGELATSAYSSGQFEVHTAVVEVPDGHIGRLSAMFRPRKTTYAKVTYADIAGLAKGVSQGGLSGPLLNTISQSDALLHVVRAFEDPGVPHSEGHADPCRDVAIVDGELMLSDLIIVERRIERLRAALKRGGDKQAAAGHEVELALMNRLHAQLDAGQPLRDLDLAPAEEKALRNFGLLSLKPMLIVLNVGDAAADDALFALCDYQHRRTTVAALQGRLEMELAQMPFAEAADFLASYGIVEPGLNRIIRLSYTLLGRHSFFTVGEDEVRAWTIPVGATAVEAAGAVHSDIARGFIRAEVIGYEALRAAGSLAAARARGQMRLEGRDYVVQDGDVINFRFNV